MKVYALKTWHTNKIYKDQGSWINEKATFNKRGAKTWIESSFSQGKDSNHDYDILELEYSVSAVM